MKTRHSAKLLLLLLVLPAMLLTWLLSGVSSRYGPYRLLTSWWRVLDVRPGLFRPYYSQGGPYLSESGWYFEREWGWRSGTRGFTLRFCSPVKAPNPLPAGLRPANSN